MEFKRPVIMQRMRGGRVFRGKEDDFQGANRGMQDIKGVGSDFVLIQDLMALSESQGQKCNS